MKLRVVELRDSDGQPILSICSGGLAALTCFVARTNEQDRHISAGT
jgi:hypothetical protein